MAVIEKVLTAVKVSKNPAEHTGLLFRAASSDDRPFNDTLKIFQAFKKSGAIFTEQYWDQTLLHIIARSAPSNLRQTDYLNLVQFLVDNGVDVTAPNGNGMSALYCFLDKINKDSRIEDYEKILTLLVPADINFRDKWGETALHTAAHTGNQEVAAWLIARGAKIDITDNRGRTAFDIFKQQGNQQGVYQLLNTAAALPQPPASALPARPATTSSHKRKFC